MSEPAALPGLEPATKLTARQAFALEKIRQHAPIDSLTLGQMMCARNGRHSVIDQCKWCVTNGSQVALELRKKRLATRKRGEGWVPAGWKPGPDYDPVDGEIPY